MEACRKNEYMKQDKYVSVDRNLQDTMGAEWSELSRNAALMTRKRARRERILSHVS